MQIQRQSEAFARRIAGMGWRDGVHTSEADTPDGHRLKVRYPWEENPHYEWMHYHDPHDRPATGIAGSLEEAKSAAEQSHKDLTGAWDPDAVQDALDPRLLGASSSRPHTPRRTPQYNRPLDRSWSDERGKPSQLVDLRRGEGEDPSGPEEFELTAARFARHYFAETDGLDVPLDSGEKKEKKSENTGLELGAPVGTAPGLNDPNAPKLPPPTPRDIGQNVVSPGGGMPSGNMGGTPSAPVSYTPSSGVDQWKQQ
jgi:hypothetical protein